MEVLGIIIARKSSKGLPHKNVLPLLGKPVIGYTMEFALNSNSLTHVICSTDDEEAARVAREYGIEVIERPPELAADHARVEDVLRHATGEFERSMGHRVDIVVLLYASVPVRKEDIADRVVAKLIESGADTAMTVAPVGKYHPAWMLRVGEGDRQELYLESDIYRRQDLPPLFIHDGAIVALKRDVLMSNLGTSPLYAWCGEHIVSVPQPSENTVDIDGPRDLRIAETVLRMKQEQKAEGETG